MDLIVTLSASYGWLWLVVDCGDRGGKGDYDDNSG